MEKVKCSVIVLVLSLLLPTLALSEKYEDELALDYYLYKHRRTLHTAMGYIGDLNQRIEKCSSANNLDAFDYLTNLLTYVLVTGGPFGIRSTGPTAAEWPVLNVSFKHIATLAVASSPDQAGSTIRFKLQQISFCNTAPDCPDRNRLNHTQANGIYHFTLAALPAAKTERFPAFQHHKVDGWFRFTADSKVIIRDPNKDQEFYLLYTNPDGACWMHAMACSNSTEFTARGFIQKLLGLTPAQREAVCNFALDFFCRTLVEEYATLLKGTPELAAEAEILAPLLKKLTKDSSSLLGPERSKILKFISNEQVFCALVSRKGENSHDTRSLMTADGSNVWNCFNFNTRWPEIWVFVYQLNILPLSINQLNANSPLIISNKIFYKFPSHRWSLTYQGDHDIHVSALHPVGVTPPPNGMTFATQGYFKTWHALKNHGFDGTEDLQKYRWIKWAI